MEKIGGGDQRYWSAKAATLNHSRRYLIKGGKKYLIGSGEQRCWSAKGCHPKREQKICICKETGGQTRWRKYLRQQQIFDKIKVLT